MIQDGSVVLDEPGLDGLIECLRGEGYEVLGPRVRDGVIAYEPVASVADLPRGFGDEQEGGRYRLRERGDGALFGYAAAPQSWKRHLHPPLVTLWRARKGDRGFELTPVSNEPPPRAFLGVRPCELAAIAVQDRVLLEGAHVDPAYEARRKAAFLVVVQCGHPAATCFCASMGTGPRAEAGFDLALTEILDDLGHRFLVEVGTERGARLLGELPTRHASEADLAAADRQGRAAAHGMGRALETTGLRDLLYRHYESPHWDEVAKRCLTCGNCTMVCPTCFCVSVEDTGDLAGLEAERRRRWDSCFGLEFSYVHGGSVRTSASARYRQWITHKLATWQDQFGVSGCVGCGRCITWCPVGIDITEEVKALEAIEQGRR
jgi:ferredoxin